MTTEENKIDKLQAVVNKEFDKAFKININGNIYAVAVSKSDIPKITSCKLQDDTMVIIVSDNIYHIDTKTIFKLNKDEQGNQTAIFNFSNKAAEFKDKREYWQNIISSENTFTQPKEIISFVKSKKLVHAFLDIIHGVAEEDDKVKHAVLKIENNQ